MKLKSLKPFIAAFTLIAVGSFVGCSKTSTKSPDVTDTVRKSLDQAGLNNVKVSQDRDKGVVTLTGQVPTDADKTQAETIAKSAAAGQVVSDEVAVVPAGNGEVKSVNSDLDKAIEKDLDATLIRHRLNKDVSYDVNNGVVTLKGNVNSQAKRAEAEKLATAVPNVQQVVNEIDVKHQKASSTSSH